VMACQYWRTLSWPNTKSNSNMHDA
jgi:hypothetical protein